MITMAKLRMADASTHGARKLPGPISPRNQTVPVTTKVSDGLVPRPIVLVSFCGVILEKILIDRKKGTLTLGCPIMVVITICSIV